MANKKAKKTNWKTLAIGAAVVLGLGGILGASGDKDPEPTPEPVKTVATATPAPTPSPVPTATPYRIHGLDPERTVYVSNSGIIHLEKDCSGMVHYTEMTLKQADAAGYSYCERCAK